MRLAEYGIALGWKLQTPGALKVYIPYRKFIAVRNIRSLKLIDSIPPEWQWTAQIPARSSSTSIAFSALPSRLDVQSSPPVYEEQDLLLPSVPQEGAESEFTASSRNEVRPV